MMSADYFSQNGNGQSGHNGDYPLLVQRLIGHGVRRKRSPFQTDCIWLNGELVPLEEAREHILNPALRDGPGVFEGIRCYETARGPALFRPDAHLKRFFQAARVLGVDDLRYSLMDLRRAVHVTVQANNFTSCYVRPLLYFAGNMGLDQPLDEYEHEPSVAVVAWEWDALKGAEKHERGVRVIVPSYTDIQSNASVSKVAGQPTHTIVAKTLAKDAGVDEAILLDAEGYIVDCTAENLFVVRDGVVHTPHRTSVLDDVARDTVITLAQDRGYTVVEAPLSRDQLNLADEVFVCGTAAEVVPVREIDFQPVGDGRAGPLTRRLQQSYFDTVRGHGKRSRGWLEYVMMEPLF